MKNFDRAYKSMAYMEMAERTERRINNYNWIEHSEQKYVLGLLGRWRFLI